MDFLSGFESITGYSLSLLVSGVVAFVSYFLLIFIIKKLQLLSQKSQPLLNLALGRVRKLYLLCFSLYFSSWLLDLAPKWEVIFEKAFISFSILQVAAVLSSFLTQLLERQLFSKAIGADFQKTVPQSLIRVLSSVLIWSLALVLVFDNLGIQITALVTGLGVGGIAIALAAQNILGDLFAALTISFDKPFKIGDHLVIGELRGIVEHIGIKTTRLRGPQGEFLVFGNEDILKSRISNFLDFEDRRILLNLGLVYDTNIQKLKDLPFVLKEIIHQEAKTRFERANLIRFGESSLDFEVIYWVQSRDQKEAQEIQHRIHIAILEKFNALDIQFAYPTRTLWHVGQKPKLL
jgi:MscS family membrane protein